MEKWIPGTVIRRLVPLTYLVRVGHHFRSFLIKKNHRLSRTHLIQEIHIQTLRIHYACISLLLGRRFFEPSKAESPGSTIPARMIL